MFSRIAVRLLFSLTITGLVAGEERSNRLRCNTDSLYLFIRADNVTSVTPILAGITSS